MRLKRVALYFNPQRPKYLETVHLVGGWLKEREIQTFLAPDIIENGYGEISKVKPSEIDLRISLGGDGTILHFLHHFPEIKAPLFAVNLGSVGFLADTDEKNLLLYLEKVLSNDFTVEQRSLIEVDYYQKRSQPLLNDVVIHRGSHPGLISLECSIGSHFVTTFSSDGLIISTSTGSTAYSLACQGPIIDPSLAAYIINPISPHTLSNRPLVVKADAPVHIRSSIHNPPLTVSLDGYHNTPLLPGEQLSIHLSKNTLPLIKFQEYDFFQTLRNKLHWSGSLEKKRPYSP